MKKKTKNSNFNFVEDARRKQEIEQYGKMVSLRPSVVHKSKKIYNRKNNKKELSNFLDNSYFF